MFPKRLQPEELFPPVKAAGNVGTALLFLSSLESQPLYSQTILSDLSKSFFSADNSISLLFQRYSCDPLKGIVLLMAGSSNRLSFLSLSLLCSFCFLKHTIVGGIVFQEFYLCKFFSQPVYHFSRLSCFTAFDWLSCLRLTKVNCMWTECKYWNTFKSAKENRLIFY